MAAVVFRLQGNLPFKPNPENPDDGGTTSLLSGCTSSIIIVSDMGIGKGMGTNKGAGKPRDTRLAFGRKGGAG